MELDFVIPEFNLEKFRERLLAIVNDVLSTQNFYLEEWKSNIVPSSHHDGLVQRSEQVFVPITAKGLEYVLSCKHSVNDTSLSYFLSELYVNSFENAFDFVQYSMIHSMDDIIPYDVYYNDERLDMDDEWSDKAYAYMDDVSDLCCCTVMDVLSNIDYTLYYRRLLKRIPHIDDQFRIWSKEIETVLTIEFPSLLETLLMFATPHLWKPKVVKSSDNFGKKCIDYNSGIVYPATKDGLDALLKDKLDLVFLLENLYSGVWIATNQAGRGKDWITYKFLLLEDAFDFVSNFCGGISYYQDKVEFKNHIYNTFIEWSKTAPFLLYYNLVLESFKNNEYIN